VQPDELNRLWAQGPAAVLDAIRGLERRIEELERRAAVSAPSHVFTPEMYGAVGDGETDDSAAFHALFSQTGALATLGGGEVRLAPATYLVNELPEGDAAQVNALIPLPVLGGSITIRGVSGSTKIKTTRTGDRYDTGEPPAVLGMMPFMQNYGRWELEGVTIELPNDPAIGGINMPLAGKLHLKDVQVTVTDPGFVTPSNPWSFGVRLPGSLNFGEVYCESLYCLGPYCGIAFVSAAHVVLINPIAQGCTVGYGIQDGGGLNGGHSSSWLYAMSEHNKHHLAGWDPSAGVRSIPADAEPAFLTVHNFDIEDGNPPMDTIDHILDVNDKLVGSFAYNRWGFAVTPTLLVSGGRKLDRRPVGLGHLATARNAAPDPALLAPGQVALWLDATDGASQLMVTAKQADGTVRTGSLPLS
jgi:hypothetical protein